MPKSTVQSALADRAATIEWEIERLQKKLDFVRTVPVDDYENGAVIVFEKKFNSSGITYTYACVKGGGSWFVTGNSQRFSWDQLMEHLYLNVSTENGGFIRAYWVSELTGIE